MTVAIFLTNRRINADTVADVLVMVDDTDPVMAWARRHGITLAPRTRFTGGTNREVVMNAMSDAGFEVIALSAHGHLGDDDRITINQWASA